MPGLLYPKFYQGSRSEYLAQYILSALGLAVPVPRQQDIGIDFHCTLARHTENGMTFYAPYNVQVKSASETDVTYGGRSKNGKWKRYEIEWLLTQTTPLFVAIVDKTKHRLDLFSTATRWFAKHEKPCPFKITLKPYLPIGENHLGPGIKQPAKVRQKTGETFNKCVWQMPIGQAVVSLTIEDVEDENRLLSARMTLQDYIYLDQYNITWNRMGLRHFHWPLIVRTNVTLMEKGVMNSWASQPDNSTKAQFRALTPIVATVLKTYQDAGMTEMIEAFRPLTKHLPVDADLELMGHMIKDAINFADQATTP